MKNSAMTSERDMGVRSQWINSAVVRRARPLAARLAAAGVLAAALATAQGAQAGSTPITVGTAGSYGVLVGSGDTLTLGGAFNMSGNLGVGASSTVNESNNNSISGTEYKDSGVTTDKTSGTTSISGGTITQSMSSVISAATSASAAAKALTATSGMTDQGGSISVNGSSVTINALTNLSENVLDISALSLTNGTLTFNDNGYTGAKFIVNITGNFNVSSSGSGKSIIQGINGASGSDIIFNIENAGSTVSITGNSTNALIGTILDPSSSVTLSGGGSLTGAILAGFNNAGKSYTVQDNSSGFNVTQLGYVARTTSVPEPPSIALFGAGIAAVAVFARRRRPV